MKKILSLIFAVTLSMFFFINSSAAQKVQAEEGALGYGLIVENNSLLYRTPTDSDLPENIYFYLPETYFVEILEQVDEVFYYVRFSNVLGYVKFSAINVKDYVPVSIFPKNLTLKISGDLSANIRELPQSSSTLVTSLPSGTSMVYLNKTAGQELRSGQSYWYFVKIPNETADKYGYIYADYISLESEIIIPNDTSPMPIEDNPNSEEKKNNTYTIWTQVIIALAVCIPVVFIIYLLFKPRKYRTPPQ